MNKQVVLITGAARRVGAEIARLLHSHGLNILIHYNTSETAAQQLAAELNQQRTDSAAIVKADLNDFENYQKLILQSHKIWQRLDILINNASRFYPTPVGTVNEQQWQDLFASNLQAPFFLSQAAAPFLKNQQGCIINIADIHANKPLKSYPIYCMAKAGLVMMTKALAKELAPEIRVNAIAPGAVLWPEETNELDQKAKDNIIAQTLLKRPGSPQDIAKAVWFLINDAPYITGQVLAVDGGRTV